MPEVPFTLKILFYCLMFAIAVDVYWGGLFAGRAGNVLGVIVAGYSVVQIILTGINRK